MRFSKRWKLRSWLNLGFDETSGMNQTWRESRLVDEIASDRSDRTMVNDFGIWQVHGTKYL
jgi:hypothetical protein